MNDIKKQGAPLYHALDREDALTHLKSSADGLSFQEAEERLLHYGPNRLTPPSKRSPWCVFSSSFTTSSSTS